MQGTNGNFYGTNAYGGAAYNFDKAGTVFGITPAGQFTTLYNFCSQRDCADGKLPGGMIPASNGNLYGFTTKGGRHVGSGCGQGGCGTIFQVTPEGTLTTVISFDVAEGSYPTSLLQATDGNLYGTTAYGGANGYGTILAYPTGVLTLLHSFDSADGTNPASLVSHTRKVYGTSNGGGTGGWGTFFTLSISLAPFVEPIPTAAKAGANVLILGNNLVGTTGVTFNGTTARFTVVSDTEIKATVPTNASTGLISVPLPPGRSTVIPCFRC